MLLRQCGKIMWSMLGPFAIVSAVSGCPSRLHRFLRLLGLTSLTRAKVSPCWPAELAQSPQTTRSFRSDILALRLDRRTAPSDLSGSRETSACCAQERLCRVNRCFMGPLPNFHHGGCGGKAIPGASVRRPSWHPAAEISVVTGHPLGS